MTDMFEQAKQQIANNPGMVDGALDQLGSLVDSATGGKFHDQIEGAKDAVGAQLADGSIVDAIKGQVGGLADKLGQ